MKEDYHKWYSPTLSKDIEMLVFGHAGYPVVLFPTTMGRFFECKNMKLIELVILQDLTRFKANASTIIW